MKYLSALIISLMIAGSIFAATDKKIYNAGMGHASSWLWNSGTGITNKYLPIVRDYSDGRVSSGWIKVTDRNPNQNFTAKLWVNYNNGSSLTTKGYNPTGTPSGTFTSAKYIYFGSTPKFNANAAYYFTLGIPGKFGNNISYVYSYSITEKD